MDLLVWLVDELGCRLYVNFHKKARARDNVALKRWTLALAGAGRKWSALLSRIGSFFPVCLALERPVACLGCSFFFVRVSSLLGVNFLFGSGSIPRYIYPPSLIVLV